MRGKFELQKNLDSLISAWNWKNLMEYWELGDYGRLISGVWLVFNVCWCSRKSFMIRNRCVSIKDTERFHLLLFSIKDSIFPIHMIGKLWYKQEERWVLTYFINRKFNVFDRKFHVFNRKFHVLNRKFPFFNRKFHFFK